MTAEPTPRHGFRVCSIRRKIFFLKIIFKKISDFLFIFLFLVLKKNCIVQKHVYIIYINIITGGVEVWDDGNTCKYRKWRYFISVFDH